MIWFGYILIFLYFYILFVCYMLSYEITKWFNVILLHDMNLDNLMFTTIHLFFQNILLLIFFYIILLFVSHSLPKNRWLFSLSLSLILIISCNSILDWWFFFVPTFGWYTLVMCFLSYLSHVPSISLIVLVWVNF